MYAVVYICPSSNLVKRGISFQWAMSNNEDKTARTLHATGLIYNQSEKQSMGCRQQDPNPVDLNVFACCRATHNTKNLHLIPSLMKKCLCASCAQAKAPLGFVYT